MGGMGGSKSDICGVVEYCPLGLGSFSGSAHFFVSKQVDIAVLGRPFLFDYDCQLNFTPQGEMLCFQGQDGRRVSISLARVNEDKGWNNKPNLASRAASVFVDEKMKSEVGRLFGGRKSQVKPDGSHFL